VRRVGREEQGRKGKGDEEMGEVKWRGGDMQGRDNTSPVIGVQRRRALSCVISAIISCIRSCSTALAKTSGGALGA